MDDGLQNARERRKAGGACRSSRRRFSREVAASGTNRHTAGSAAREDAIGTGPPIVTIDASTDGDPL
jgi:hypothetical protein